MIQNPFKILTEAVKSEDFEIEDLDADTVETDFEDIYNDTEELDIDLDCTEEMVNVIEQETSVGVRYLVEMDNLAKFMESANIDDVSVAMTRIAECNSLNADTMCVVIESDDYAQEVLNEAKKSRKSITSKTLLANIKSSADVIRLMKTKGIKVLKKKSKSKSKKKR